VIRIGLGNDKKSELVRKVASDGVTRVVVIGPQRYAFDLGIEAQWVDWPEVIQYRFYYRLLQEIDAYTLVVLNECLRTQNRHDLTYNCIRNFLQQTKRQVIFQRLPIIDTLDDLSILVDFDTRSRWKRESFRPEWLTDLDIHVTDVSPSLKPTVAEATASHRKAYETAREEAFAKLGHGDPHTLPRTLHVAAGKARLPAVQKNKLYVARNGRVKLPNFTTYEHATEPRVVFDFCHRFIDFSAFLATTGQRAVECVVSDLPVDQWYLKRYTDWARRVSDACSALHG